MCVCLYTVFCVKQYEGGWETKMYTFPMEQVQLHTRKATEKPKKKNTHTNDANLFYLKSNTNLAL